MSWIEDALTNYNNAVQNYEEAGQNSLGPTWEEILLYGLAVDSPSWNPGDSISDNTQRMPSRMQRPTPPAPYSRPSYSSGKYTSPWGGINQMTQDFLEVNPESSYQEWGRALGAEAQSPFERHLKSQYDTHQQDYYGQSARNPGLTWLDYLDKSSSTTSSIWEGLSPRQKGYRNPSGGRAQYTFPK